MSELNLSNSVATYDVAKQNQIVKQWAPKVKRQLKIQVGYFRMENILRLLCEKAGWKGNFQKV